GVKILSMCSPRKGIIHFSGRISIRDLEGKNQGTPDVRGCLQDSRSDLRSTELRRRLLLCQTPRAGYKFHGRSHSSRPRQPASSRQHIASIATPAGSFLSFPEPDTNLQRRTNSQGGLSCLENQFARWF